MTQRSDLRTTRIPTGAPRSDRRGALAQGISLGVVLLIAASLIGAAASPVVAQSNGWSAPEVISTTSRFSWFPDITVDSQGRVHVVWDSSPDLEKLSTNSLLLNAVLAMHTFRNPDGTWSRPNDMWFYPGRADIFRASLAADSTGRLYFASALVGFSSALADQSASAQAWAPAQGFLSGGGSYGSALTVGPEDSLYLLWDTLLEVEAPDPLDASRTIKKLKADIFFRTSADGGRTWAPPTDLSNTDVGEAREQIKVDADGVVYASWETGWDRQTEEAAPFRATVVRVSYDSGQTWAQPTVFEYPDRANTQMAIAPDNRGSVMAVWRSLKQDDIYYAWSGDAGKTWSAPKAIPTLLARDIAETRFDGYHMAADSNGVIHLVAVGRRTLDQGPALYHLTWDGEAWSSPQLIYNGEGFPEWPRIAISQGNQMHVVWFVRDQYFTEGANYKIWYSHNEADAPAQALPPTPTPTATPAPPTPTLQPTPTPTLILPKDELRADPVRLRDEKDDLAELVVATLPVALLLGAFVVIVKNLRGRM